MLESLLVWAIVITFATLTLLARRYPTAFGQASKKVTDLALLLLALVGIMSYRDLRSWTHILSTNYKPILRPLWARRLPRLRPWIVPDYGCKELAG